MAKQLTKKEKVEFPDRIRFNWGYHDAAQCVEKGWDKSGQCFAGDLKHITTPNGVLDFHFDEPYAKGWAVGYVDAQIGWYHGNSEDAWREFGELSKEGVKIRLQTRRYKGTDESIIQPDIVKFAYKA